MAKKCLVYETLGNVTSMKVKESLDNNEIRLSGVFGVCGVKNNNNRVYSKENYGQMVESLQKTIMTEGCLGELEHPNSMNINLNNVSHKIESVEMHEDGTVTGSIILLNTEKGRNAKAIVEAGVPLYISSRALGSIDEGGNVTLSSLKTYDLVGSPGFSQASLHLAENQKFESLNESMCAVILEGDDCEGEKKEDSKKEDSKKEDDKEKKEKEEKANMKDLKDAVDKLSEKVESLEAELHIAKESINEKNEEIQSLQEQVSEINPTNYEAIESWIKEEFKPEFSKEMSEGVQKWVAEEFAPVVQNWICEQFAPEVQKWVVEQYSPEVQKWVVEQYSPEVQKWVVEQYSPEVQKWVVENYSSELQTWITEHFGKDLENKINTNISEYLESQSNDKFDNIDRMLEMLESNKNTKEDEVKMLKEQQEKQLGKYATCYAIANMPNEYRPMFEGLSETKKDQIALRSRAYDFTKAGVMESFWSSIDFNEKPSVQINENTNTNPVNAFTNNIAQQMMRFRG